MTSYEYKRIPLSLIDIPVNRLRGKRSERVETLAKDMAANGQLQPILVVEEENGRYSLDDGALRVAALGLNKASEIDARVTPAESLSPDERRLREIMANLNREEYTALERAEALAELKRVYEAIYPETRKGGDRKSQAAKNKQENLKEIFSFRSTAAEATGLCWRSINIAIAIANGLTPATKSRLRGTCFERKQSDLRALSEVDAGIQEKALDFLLLEPVEAGSIADAIVLAEGRRPDTPEEKAYRAILDKWSRFEIKQKRSFVRLYRTEIISILREEGAL